MKHLLQKHSKYLWLSLLLLLVGATAIAIPKINGINEDSPVAKIGDNGYATLQAAIEAAESGATIELLQDVDLSSAVTGTSRLPISKSLTFNGNNRVITMGGRGFGVGMNATSKIDVVFNDLTIENSANGARCIDTRGNVNSLTLNNVILKTDGATSGYTQPLTIGGNQAVAATVNITNSTIQTNNDGTAYYAIITFNPVNMTISNSTIKGWACIYAKGVDGSAGSAGSVINIDGSTLVSSNAYSGVSNDFSAFMMEDNNVTINVTNSNITINNTGDQVQSIAGYNSINLSGNISLGEGNTVNFAGPNDCSFVINGASATFEVSGGTFNTPIPEEYCAEGFTLVDNGDGTYSVSEPSYVAQIGSTKYVSLQAALDAAHEMTGNVTITLIDNNEGYSIVHQKEGLNLTIDGDDKTVAGQIIIDGDGRASGTETLTIQNIKFVGDGTNFCSGTSSFVEVPSTKTSGTQYYTNKYNYAHNITITDCSFTSTTSGLSMAAVRVTSNAGAYNVVITECTGTNLHSLAQLVGTTGGTVTDCTVTGSESFVNVNGGGGEFTVSGNTFTSAEGADGYGIRENGSSTAVITLTDNTFTAASAVVLGKENSQTAGTINVESGIYTGTITKTEAATGKIVVSGGYFLEAVAQDYIVEGKVCVSATDKPGYFTIGDPTYVAQIGETKYVSLQAAVDAAYAMTGDVTIELIDDITEYAIVKQKADLNLTIDGKEKTMMGNIVVDGMGRYNGSETLTIQNVKFEGNSTNFCSGTSSFVEVPSLKTSGTPYYTNGNNYAHNITISNCSFTSTEIVESERTIRAFGSASKGGSCYNITINNVTGSNLHSLAQLVGATGGNITNNTVTASESFVNVNGGGGNFTISGNTFTSDENASAGYGIRENGTSTAVITLTDNNFTAANVVKLGKDGSATKGTINVVSGTYVGDIVKDIAATATGKIVISGGHFSAPLADAQYVEFIAEGLCGANGLYPDDTVAPNGVTTPVAQITNGETITKYASLEAAVEAATAGQTITLLADIDATSQIEVGKQVTLDLNGKTIEYKSAETLTSGVIMVLRGGDLTVTDSSEGAVGAIKSGTKAYAGIALTKAGETSTETAKLTVNNGIIEGYYYAITGNGSRHGTEITISGGVIRGICEGDNVGIFQPQDGTLTITGGAISGASGVELRSGTLTVTGGTITATSDSYSYTANGSGTTTVGAAIAIAQHSTGKAIAANITDGTLSGTKLISVVDAQNNSLDGVAVTVKDEFTATSVIPDGFKWVSNDDGMSTLTPLDPVAKIGEKIYYSLAAAVAAVPTDGTETTIELLANVTENVVVKDGKNIVLDLGGKTVTGYIDQYDSNITLTNGNLAGTFYVNGGPSSAEAGYNKFTLAADATITSDWGFILYQGPNGNDAYGSTIDINGTINGTAWVMGNITEGNSVINVNSGAKIDGDVFGLNGLATLNVKAGATIIGAETGIEVRAGNLNVEGGTITSTSTEYKVESNGSGTTTYGAAIAVAQHTTGLPINANITGGTLSGIKTISVADPEGGNYAGVVVTAKDELTEGEVVIPDGYIWISNNDGTSTLTKAEDGEYALIDGQNYPFMNLKSDISVPEVTYQRSFSESQVNKHQAWFVPMDYTITDDDVANFTFYKLHMVAGAAVPGDANANSIYLYVIPMNAGEVLQGNRPYTIKPKSAVTDHVFTAENTKLYAPNTGSRLNVTTSSNSYDFYGKYMRESYSGRVGDMYYLSGGSLHPNNENTTFLPYRWIIKVTSNNINDGYSKVEFSIVEDGDATGIDSSRIINSDEVEGIYTTNGMKVDEPVRGINIIRYKNGKTQKIIVK